MAGEDLSPTPLEGPEDLAPMLDNLRGLTEERAEIRRRSTLRPGPDRRAPRATATHLDCIEAMAALGVTWNSVGTRGDSLDHAIGCLEQYGYEVIAQS